MLVPGWYSKCDFLLPFTHRNQCQCDMQTSYMDVPLGDGMNLTRLVGDGAAEGREGALLALTRPRDHLTPHAQQAQLVAASAGEHPARAAPVPLQGTLSRMSYSTV